MAPMYSFQQGLAAALTSLQPRTVLEWGPGKSTSQMLACRSVARIVTIEHNAVWYNRYLRDFKTNSRVRIKHLVDMYEYVNFPRGTFDLIYIDGRRRNQCLIRAQLLVSRNGLVLIHDAERPSYQNQIDLFPHRAFTSHHWIAAMSFSRSAIDRWKDALTKE